ncbi:MAG: hypothetical protein ABJE47_19215 [bacterium]
MQDLEVLIMAQRNVTDTAGRSWQVQSAAIPEVGGVSARPIGLDVVLNCTTATVAKPVAVTVGWQWEKMADSGLARMISLASPLPKR